MYCKNCGSEIEDNSQFCPKCGNKVEDEIVVDSKSTNQSGIATAIKIFMILGCVAMCWMIIPLLWCVPMTISVNNSLNRGEKISVLMKVCTLLFVSTIGGILLLCNQDC